MKPEVRRAHMVSRRYISAWGDERGRIDVIDLEQKRGYETTFGRATVVSYAYEATLLVGAKLEQQYDRIESAGLPSIVKLRNGRQLSEAERVAVIAFLDMHIERGNFADQTKVHTPAVAVMTDGRSRSTTLGLADRLVLSRHVNEGADRLAKHRLEDWNWSVHHVENLVTGDGAVLRFAKPGRPGEPGSVFFPLSPTRLLQIGDLPMEEVPLNSIIASRSRRWLIGERGTLDWNPANFEPFEGLGV